MRLIQDVEREVVGLDAISAALYEASVPRAFWTTTRRGVNANNDVFKLVRRFVSRHRQVRSSGVGLLLMGDNGCGKTTFVCWALKQLLLRHYSVYYTTMPQLDLDIKRGFNDPVCSSRLEELLQRDFVVIDEVGKEWSNSLYAKSRLEHLLKTRYDEADPTLLVSNLDFESLVLAYGPNVESLLGGRYRKACLEPGDLRRRSAASAKTILG